MKNSVRGRNTDKLATVCNDNVRPYSRGYICRIGITREGTREKKTFVSEKKKKVRVHVQHWAREKIETERESKKTLIQRASVCKPYTVHHTGLSGAIQNGSEPRSRSSGPQA